MKKLIFISVFCLLFFALCCLTNAEQLLYYNDGNFEIIVNKLSEPNEPAEPNEPNEPVEPNESEEPNGPTEPNEPAEPNEPNEPVALRTIFVDCQLADDCVGNYSIANRDNSGSDGDAYNTAQEAADASVPGDLIYFRAGTYYEQTTTQSKVPVMRILTSGEPDRPITYKNYNGEEVILSAYNPDNGATKYNVIALGLQPSSSQDVSGQGVSNIIIDGLIAERGSYRGIAVFGPADKFNEPNNPTENVIIRNCIARYNIGASGTGIKTEGTLINCIIENCEAYGNKISGISYGRISKDWHAPEPEDRMSAARYCIMRNCLSHENNDPEHPGNSDGMGGSHMYRCLLENNIALNNGDDGIDVYASIECTIKNNISMLHNYPGGNGCGFKFSAGGGGRHTLEDNIAAFDDGIAFEGSNPSNMLRTYYYSRLINNLAYNCRKDFLFGLESKYTSYPGFEQTYQEGNIVVNTENPVVIDTDFEAGWSLAQKMSHIRNQVEQLRQ